MKDELDLTGENRRDGGTWKVTLGIGTARSFTAGGSVVWLENSKAQGARNIVMRQEAAKEGGTRPLRPP